MPLNPIPPTGVDLRRLRADDAPFIVALFVTLRWAEFEPLGWPDEVRRDFLAQQSSMQSQHYAARHGEQDFLVVERDGAPIGRLYLAESARELRIVDISLIPEVCGAGIGTALLRAVQELALARGKCVSIHVERNNPARRLYRRLGFVETPGDQPYLYMQWREERLNAAP